MVDRRVVVVGGVAGLLVGGGALALGGDRFLYAVLRPGFSGPSLRVQEAFEQASVEDITLVDIRRPDEWAATGSPRYGHRLDMQRDDFVAALTRLVEGDRNAPIALICARGVRSARLSNQLMEAGFTNIIDVPEGMLGSDAGPGWLDWGLPVEHD